MTNLTKSQLKEKYTNEAANWFSEGKNESEVRALLREAGFNIFEIDSVYREAEQKYWGKHRRFIKEKLDSGISEENIKQELEQNGVTEKQIENLMKGLKNNEEKKVHNQEKLAYSPYILSNKENAKNASNFMLGVVILSSIMQLLPILTVRKPLPTVVTLGFNVLFWLTYIISIVVFIQWFYRAYNNINKISLSNLKYSPGMSIGIWFIPIANWIIPFWIMNENWNHTSAILQKHAPQEVISDKATLNAWWGFYIASGIINLIASFMLMGSGRYIETIQTVMMLRLLSFVLFLIAGVAGYNMIRIFNKMEMVMYENQGEIRKARKMESKEEM